MFVCVCVFVFFFCFCVHRRLESHSNFFAIWIIDVVKTYHYSSRYSDATAAISVRYYVAEANAQKCNSNQPLWPETNETHGKFDINIIFMLLL